MANLNNLKNSIKNLIDGNSTPELAEKVGKISAEIELIEKEDVSMVAKYEELRQKYVKAIQNNSFPDDGTSKKEEGKPLTFEECYNKVKSK